MDEQQDISARVALGRRIRQERERQGISLRQFALMVNLSYPYLSNVENGKQSVTIDVIDKIASGLGMQIRELF